MLCIFVLTTIYYCIILFNNTFNSWIENWKLNLFPVKKLVNTIVCRDGGHCGSYLTYFLFTRRSACLRLIENLTKLHLVFSFWLEQCWQRSIQKQDNIFIIVIQFLFIFYIFELNLQLIGLYECSSRKLVRARPTRY